MVIILINLKMSNLRALLEGQAKPKKSEETENAGKGLLEIGVDVFGMKQWDFDFVLFRWPSLRFDILDDGFFHTPDLKIILK